MSPNERTRVAILGTLAEFHNEAIPFDLAGLLELVAAINPDLLCLDITPGQWRERDFDTLPPEYREALLPLAHQTDIVVVPIGVEISPSARMISGWRRTAIGWLRRRIESIQRRSPSPAATNQGWRHDLTNILYDAIRWLSAGEKKRELTDYVECLVQKIIDVSQRDPDSRVLVVVNVQHCHVIRRQLRKRRDVEVTTYRRL